MKLVSDGVLRGTGAMKAFMVATFSDLILRVVLAFVLAGMMGPMGVWLSWPVGWIVGTGGFRVLLPETSCEGRYLI